jgi:hypothetical protein
VPQGAHVKLREYGCGGGTVEGQEDEGGGAGNGWPPRIARSSRYLFSALGMAS